MTQDEINDLMDRLGDVLQRVFDAGCTELSADENQAADTVISSGAATLLFEVRSRVGMSSLSARQDRERDGAITLFELVHGQPPMRAQIGKAN